MAALMWTHNCSAGIQAMDDQHGILLDALNELRLALVRGTDCQSVRVMLTRVAELMRLHVESEEKLLARNGFPGLADHQTENRKLLERLAIFNVRFEQRQSNSVYELVEYLRRWFTNHTGVSGRTYGPWLLQHGVQ
jgi:hemerythrin